MLKNTLINKIAIKKIAKALAELNDKVVYVGGAVVSVYIDDSAADDVRPTKDIDISIEIFNLGELEKLRQKLNDRGFFQSADDDVICRFRFQEIKVDVMTTEPIGWAPANPWFKDGFANAETINIEGTIIKILPLPYFLASKFSAFYDRGGNDPRFSKDFEDIVYILNHTSNVEEIFLKSREDVRTFLKTAFQKILNSDILQEAIIGNLPYDNQQARFEKILLTLKSLVR